MLIDHLPAFAEGHGLCPWMPVLRRSSASEDGNAKRVSTEALAQADVLRRVPPKMEEPRAMPVGLHY